MNHRISKLITAAALVAGAAARAYADPSNPWSLSVIGGYSVAESGSLRAPRTSTITDLGAIDPALSGTPGTLTLDKLRYEDLFRRRFDTGLELDYSFDPNLQTYGRFSYESLGGRTQRVGVLSTDGLESPAGVAAHFADADNMTFELGSRYFWQTGTDWRPFAGAALGATHLDGIRASFTSPETTLALTNAQFTRSGVVFSQSLETGVEYDPDNNFGLRLSIDADHFGAPRSADDSQLSELGFDASHDAHSRWAFPLSVAAAYHF
jgi:hypothetical protein